MHKKKKKKTVKLFLGTYTEGWVLAFDASRFVGPGLGESCPSRRREIEVEVSRELRAPVVEESDGEEDIFYDCVDYFEDEVFLN